MHMCGVENSVACGAMTHQRNVNVGTVLHHHAAPLLCAKQKRVVAAVCRGKHGADHTHTLQQHFA